MGASTLEIRDLSKEFISRNQRLSVLEEVNLAINPGEFVSIVGTSGCGKTTLLRLISGLENECGGSITFGGERIDGPSIDRGMVFQEPRLLPWLTVEENVAFGFAAKNAGEKKRTVQEHLELVGLRGFEKAYPTQLSGGMAQRVAITRALVNRPKILLLDEPLGALDALTRMWMQRELEKIWKQEGIAMIMVTHDIGEAICLGDRVVVMSCRPGKIKRIIPVDLSRPRDTNSVDFIRIREAVFEELNLQAERYFSYSI